MGSTSWVLVVALAACGETTSERPSDGGGAGGTGGGAGATDAAGGAGGSVAGGGGAGGSVAGTGGTAGTTPTGGAAGGDGASGSAGAGGSAGAVDGGDAGQCAPGLTACMEDDGVVRCVDLESSRCHCGACDGEKCVCSGGLCADCGAALLTYCAPPLCVTGVSEGVCVDLSEDDEHCGWCWKKCPAGTICSKAYCVPWP